MPAAPDGTDYALWLSTTTTWCPPGSCRTRPTPRCCSTATPRLPTEPASPSSPRAAPDEPTADVVALFEFDEPDEPHDHATHRRRRLRGRRPDRGVRRLAHRRGHALRGRRPARRPRRHPPGATARALAIDTGFIVHNPRTYPVLLRLFAELGVATQPSEMSMSIRDDDTGLEWAGALGRRGLFPTAANLRDPRYLWMLAEIPRFHRRAKRLLARPTTRRATSRCGEFLDRGRFSAYFGRHFMEPLVAAVWSCDPDGRARLPGPLPVHVPRAPRDARRLRLAAVAHGHRRVAGVRRRRVGRRARARSALGTKVTSVLETAGRRRGHRRQRRGDDVRRGRHRDPPRPGAGDARRADPAAAGRCSGDALLAQHGAAAHRHVAAAARPDAWASWNFRRPTATSGGVTVTYDLTRLQRLRHGHPLPGDARRRAPRRSGTVIERMEYEHPLYNPTSVAAQRRLPEIDTDRMAFAGAYHGWGFHEDGARSGLAAAERLGLGWPRAARSVADSPGRPSPRARHEPPRLRRRSGTPGASRSGGRSRTGRTPGWSTSTTCPTTGCSAGSRRATTSATRIGRSSTTSTRSWPSTTSTSRGGRVLMAANARAFGYCFNPISVFWCWDPPASWRPRWSRCTTPTATGTPTSSTPTSRAGRRSPKAMYVSPFHGTDGTYELAVPVPGERLDVAVTLHSDDGEVQRLAVRPRSTPAGGRHPRQCAARC